MKARLLVLSMGVLLIAARAASAQSADPYFTDLSVNYDVVDHQDSTTSNAGAHVDIASTMKRHSPFIGPVGEVGFNHFDGATIVSAMGGLRIRANVDRRVLPFAQVLIGLYHCGVCEVNDFALQFVGGIDFGRRDNAFRVRTQFDVRRMFDDGFAFNNERFSVGLVFPLNR